MKFRVKRTSGGNQHEPPCEHPTLRDETPEQDRLGDPEDYEHLWAIEVADLVDLMNLGRSVANNRPWPHRVIVGTAESGTLPTIEIYDTYRE